MTAWLRGAALALVMVAGVASLLATSPPPPASVEITSEPAVLCVGDEVTIRWDVFEGSTGAPPELSLATWPVDAFDPPLEGLPIAGEGAVVARVVRPAYVSAASATSVPFVDVRQLARVRAAWCEQAGFQDPNAAKVLALAFDDTDETLLAALRSSWTSGAPTMVRRLDAAFASVSEIELDARIEALTVAADGGFVVVGDHVPEVASDAPTPPRRALIQRHDASGDVVWTASLDTLDADGARSVARAVAWLGDDVVAVGRVSVQGAQDVGFVARFDAGGDLVWERRIAPTGASGGFASAASVRVTADDRVYVGGATDREVGGPKVGVVDAFVVAFDADGVRLPWSQQIAGHEAAGAIAFADAGTSIALVGRTVVAWPLDGTDSAWTALPQEGEVWRRLAETPDGALVVAGSVVVEVDVPARHDITVTDLVVHRFEAGGAPAGTWRIGSLGATTVRDMVVRGPVALVGGWSNAPLLAPLTGGGAIVVEAPLD